VGFGPRIGIYQNRRGGVWRGSTEGSAKDAETSVLRRVALLWSSVSHVGLEREGVGCVHFFDVEAEVSVVVGSEVVGSEVMDSEVVDSEVVGSEVLGSEVVNCRVCIRRSGRVYGLLILYVDVAVSIFG
jgi:hypothetical protein